MIKVLILLCLLVSLFSVDLISQQGSFGIHNARTMGMGNTGVASRMGLFSQSRNPAGLFNPNDSALINVMLPNIAAKAYTNSLTLGDIKYIFEGENGGGKFLTDADKTNILDAFKDDGYFSLDAQIGILSASFRPFEGLGVFAISVTDYSFAGLTAPPAFLDLLLFGNEINKDYNFDNLAMRSHISRTYSVSYADMIQTNDKGLISNLSYGATIKYVQGLLYGNMETNVGSILTNDNFEIEGNFNATSYSASTNKLGGFNPFSDVGSGTSIGFMPSAAGNGVGFDIGVIAELQNCIKIGASINDIGFISWSDNAYQKEHFMNFTLNDVLSKKQVDSLVNGVSSRILDSDGFMTALPMVFRLGVELPVDSVLFDVPGELILLADYNQGFTEVSSNFLIPRFGLGLEWNFFSRFLSFRTGWTQDQSAENRIAFGLGLSGSLVDFYISTYDVLALAQKTQHASVGLAIMLKI